MQEITIIGNMAMSLYQQISPKNGKKLPVKSQRRCMV